jgi:hypothetical protein
MEPLTVMIWMTVINFDRIAKGARDGYFNSSYSLYGDCCCTARHHHSAAQKTEGRIASTGCAPPEAGDFEMLGLGLAALLLAKRRAWLTPRIGA